MPRSEHLFLQDILDACRALGRFLAGKPFGELIDDEILSAAVLQKLAVIGEASARLSEETKLIRPLVPWADIIGLRNIAVHGYFGIKWNVIWSTATEDVPLLATEVLAIMAERGFPDLPDDRRQ